MGQIASIDHVIIYEKGVKIYSSPNGQGGWYRVNGYCEGNFETPEGVKKIHDKVILSLTGNNGDSVERFVPDDVFEKFLELCRKNGLEIKNVQCGCLANYEAHLEILNETEKCPQ